MEEERFSKRKCKFKKRKKGKKKLNIRVYGGTSLNW